MKLNLAYEILPDGRMYYEVSISKESKKGIPLNEENLQKLLETFQELLITYNNLKNHPGWDGFCGVGFTAPL